uniref:Ionotropic glutamate receptor L-glutamate and glycine-binding domain-containing protein n=1 Tax=Ditylenchus dipsaci TaxID=166011 RepID=A0A915DR92_9BILA
MDAENRQIRVVFGRNPPDAFDTCREFPTLTPSIDCPFPGWMAEIVKMLADYLKLEIIPVVLDDNIGDINWGYNDNGSWTGVLGMIKAGEADTM